MNDKQDSLILCTYTNFLNSIVLFKNNKYKYYMN